jgi:hypothetical protein
MSKGIHPVPAQESDSDGVERAYQAQFKFIAGWRLKQVSYAFL